MYEHAELAAVYKRQAGWSYAELLTAVGVYEHAELAAVYKRGG